MATTAIPQKPPAVWQCPKCHYDSVAEVSTGCKVQTRVLGVDAQRRLIYGQHTSVQPGTVAGYVCAQCGEEVRDGPVTVRSREQLVSLLLEGTAASPSPE